MNIFSLLNHADEMLSSGGMQESRSEAEIILSKLLNCSRNELYLFNTELASLAAERFEDILKRRLTGEPLQYILGTIEFYGFEFRIDKDVFIPRPETELLVEEALKWLNIRCLNSSVVNILDIGTGCGNIAISMAGNLPNARIVAVDISKKALRIAKENARINSVLEKIEFLEGDIYEPLLQKGIRFDAILSNPPYVAAWEFGILQKEVLQEPRVALDGGLDGLEIIKRIIISSHKFLKEHSCIFLEIGYNQAEKAAQLLRENNFKDIYSLKDYSGIERLIVGKI